MCRFMVITCTPHAVTCVAMEAHKNVLKPQGSPLCKQNCHVPHVPVPIPPLWPYFTTIFMLLFSHFLTFSIIPPFPSLSLFFRAPLLTPFSPSLSYLSPLLFPCAGVSDHAEWHCSGCQTQGPCRYRVGGQGPQ